MIKQYYKSIGVKKRKQDVIAFVNTVTQFIHRGSYAHNISIHNESGEIRNKYRPVTDFVRVVSVGASPKPMTVVT
jgi:hypothetical protein